ncbi:helix-turn-helix transcriptional regulator [Agaribacterium sp. ZY112]|uniref:helix-turn-helix transcriptional regulator n=1 Tax=Agaribacterium sp. ZY112 TaxID=3233574 RepID=UPI0035239553
MLYLKGIPQHYVIVSIMGAQLFLMVSLYFTFVARHVLKRVDLFNVFVATYMFYLIGHSLQIISTAILAYSILYLRMSMLLGIGLPSLTLFLFYQCGISLRKIWLYSFYALGLFLSVIYCIGSDAYNYQIIFSEEYAQLLPVTLWGAIHIDAEMLALVLISLLPTSYLLYIELTEERRNTCLAFLIGTFVLTLLYLVGLYQRTYWFYYIGAVLTSAFWVWAVYVDVKSTKSQAQKLKEELQLFINNENSDFELDLKKLLISIESDSQGNLNRYKLKVRELLDELTDSTIEAGGDAESLLERNLGNIDTLLKSPDLSSVRSFATQETAELSNMISQLPAKRSVKIIAQTQEYIERNFHKAIEAADLAAEVNVSQSYLMRCFKKETGKTIKQYLTQYRIEQAKLFLKEKSVSEVAFSVGYNDSNYFGNVFKKHVGIGPQRYKKEQYG